MDNRIFNVNGESYEMLLSALKLAFAQHGDNTKAAAWKFMPDKGFVLLWHVDRSHGSSNFPVPLDANEVAPMIMRWLKSSEAEAMVCDGWDKDEDHDGSNERGWRVYVEDWGFVGNDHYAICAIRPVWLWYGK